MRRREAILVLTAGAVVVLALLAVFAIELSDTQAKSKHDVQARVHERAVLAAGLIDSLFQAVEQQVPTYTKTYGGRTVSVRTMNANRDQDTYVALLDQSGRVLVSSAGFTPQARTDLRISAALRLLRSGKPYGLGNVLPYGRSGVINLAASFPTQYGPRILLTGFSPQLLSSFLGAELAKIPGVSGARNYVLDSDSTVLASTDRASPVGSLFTDAPAPGAHASVDRDGSYYDQVGLTNSTWRIVLVAPDAQLFASVSGLRKWIPWAIFLAFALFACAALLLGRRQLRSAGELREVNARLESLNGELNSANSALKLRAAELARSNGELEQFASIASHDLQEPLRKVRTFTEQLTTVESDRLSEKGRDYLERTNAAAERMQTLISGLLKYSRVTTNGRPFVPVNLTSVVDEVLEDLELELERSGALVDVGHLPTINADPVQMRQLMQNLLSNALKFRRAAVTPEIAVAASSAAERVTVTVTDNGIGFEDQYNRRIFRVFERLHGRSEYPGTGIGLALCRKIVERHGGTIVADATPGRGAKFTVTLPVDATDEARIAARPEHNGAEVSEKVHVTA